MTCGAVDFAPKRDGVQLTEGYCSGSRGGGRGREGGGEEVQVCTRFDCHPSVKVSGKHDCTVFITNFQLYFLEGAPLTAAATRTRTAFIGAAAARGGRVIQARRCCAGMQQCRLRCRRWPVRVQFHHGCKADSE
jgi:hypothetical protein